MTKTRILAVPLAALIALGISAPVVAQVTTGTIVGTVTDAGGVVPGATVTVREVNKGTTSTYVTDATGNYTASFLVPGPTRSRSTSRASRSRFAKASSCRSISGPGSTSRSRSAASKRR